MKNKRKIYYPGNCYRIYTRNENQLVENFPSSVFTYVPLRFIVCSLAGRGWANLRSYGCESVLRMRCQYRKIHKKRGRMLWIYVTWEYLTHSQLNFIFAMSLILTGAVLTSLDELEAFFFLQLSKIRNKKKSFFINLTN